ncbi:MAG: cytochrome ubiquinol oxidase subunit I [Planctomycetaceae bacterium]|nr:cytochrome ubiquinol oxidase subunit I [Planctomycetaceae bacterium]
MHYPWWYVPVLTAPMLIAVIAVIHVVVSHYAVGGGILLALENQFAVKTGSTAYRDYLHQHARFFVLLTVAFGAITGVGIWWTIALTSPLATEFLIRTFVFGWAIEWVFFIVEIVAAFIMYYCWTKMPPRTHVKITWIYALAAWISLVLITGITAFMLDSRSLFSGGTYSSGIVPEFWHAFFNVQFLPQMLTRTGGALLLAALYVFLHCSWVFRNTQSEMPGIVIKRMTKYIIAGTIFVVIGVVWGGLTLRLGVWLIIERSVLTNILITVFFGASALVLLGSLFGLFAPKQINIAFAGCLFIFGITALGSAEFMREAIRKPWIVDGYVLGNQIYADEIEERQANGFIQPSNWLNNDGGGTVFMYHCNNCHALNHGVSAVAPLLAGENKNDIKDKIRKLNQPIASMPPWCGTEAELEALADFLEKIRPD